MVRHTPRTLFTLLLPLIWFLSSSTASAQANRGTPEQIAFFEQRIRPLLVNHCYECHSRSAKKLRGELALDSRAGVRKGGASGSAIVPGQPDASLLIKAIRHDDKDLRMPPKGKLSAAEIADLAAWVRMGAPDPRDEQVAGVGQSTGIDLEKGRKHWSFQPVRAAVPPTVTETSWPLTPIDRFILANLETRKLRPVEVADRRTLIRRATYDLTGLPPTPEETEAFLRDDAPDAFARVLERLLASPAYGERWGRHWLDVVRYADTAGDNSDYPIPQMYQYRNWVIDAIGRDLPYDQFVRVQLAGDRIPADSEADRRKKIIATGYLANARRFGSYEDARYPWHLTVEDTIDNFGKAFLGVTLGCARCHDHKFDPFLAEDYYGLYGFFSSTRYPWPGIELDRVPKDLVPLAPAEVVAAEIKVRQQKLAEMDVAIKRLEASKAALEKALRGAAKGSEPGLKKQLDEALVAVKAARKERDQFAKRPLPYETAYAVIDGRNEPKKRIGQVGDVRLQLKGDPDRPGKLVPRRFPLILGGQVLPTGIKGSGRLELARWLTDPANPL